MARPIMPGDIVATRQHKDLVFCQGFNGCRPEEMYGEAYRNGRRDRNSFRAFYAEDVVGINEGRSVRFVLPGTVESGVHYLRKKAVEWGLLPGNSEDGDNA